MPDIDRDMDALDLASSQTALARKQRASGRVEISVVDRQGTAALQSLIQEGCGKARLPRIGQKTCEQVVLINSSGGITGDDRLSWTVNVGANAHFTATTQACEKVYAAAGEDAPATVHTNIRVEKSGALLWLPQETILYDRAKLKRRIEAQLFGSARLLLVEPIAFGRLAMGEAMETGHFSDQWRVERDGRLIHAEALRFSGDVGQQMNRTFAIGDQAAMATMALFARDAETQLDRLRQALPASDDAHAAATAWNGKLIARFVAVDSYALRQSLLPAIAALTNGVGVPKVWAL
ncbi:MAG: urease accessory protein UreD [Pseudomonadota bacterium]